MKYLLVLWLLSLTGFTSPLQVDEEPFLFVTDVESPTDQGMLEVDRDVSVHWWKYERESTTITYVLHGGPEGHTEWMRRNAND